MTDQERQILEEAEAQAFESASAENAPLTTGIRPAPGVEGTESVLDGQLFGLDFIPDDGGNEPTASA